MENSQSNNSHKVLIVEDDMLLSLVQERLIEKLGYEVVGKTGNGKEAIEKFKELRPDLILMDIVLKGEMDGVQAMEKIREISSDVPVIYLSGNSDRYNYERAKQTNFADYLVKPISSKDLAGPLENIFEDQPEGATTERSIKNLNSNGDNYINKTA